MPTAPRTLTAASATSADSADSLAIAPGDRFLGGIAGLFLSRGRGIHPDRVIDSWEIIHVRRGTLALAEHDGRRVLDRTVHQGQALILRPGLRHRGARPYDPGVWFTWLHSTIQRASGRVRRQTLRQIPLLTTVARPARLAELTDWYLADQQTSQPEDPGRHHLIGLMLDELASARATPSTADALAAAARSWIATHSHEPIGIREVARALDCHPDHLGRCFRRSQGRTVVTAIQDFRIEEAKMLLRHGDRTIAAIAREIGYGSIAHFRGIFRRRTGLAPDAWRRAETGAPVFLNSR